MRHDHSNVYNFHIDIHHSESLGAEVGDPREDEPGRAVEQGEHPAAADDAPGAGQRADVLKCSHKWKLGYTCLQKCLLSPGMVYSANCK